eukprot:9501094-Pyramimonas_sp.AAC.1
MLQEFHGWRTDGFDNVVFALSPRTCVLNVWRICRAAGCKVVGPMECVSVLARSDFRGPAGCAPHLS